MATGLTETTARALLKFIQRARNPVFNTFTVQQAATVTGLTTQQTQTLINALVARGWIDQLGTEYSMTMEQTVAAQSLVTEYALDRMTAGGIP